MYSLSDQILTFAALLEAIVLAPVLLEFIIERRKRSHAVELSIEIVPVRPVHIAGVGEILADIADLVDRARNPAAYRELSLGNEILIAGPPLSGKKTLARRIAADAAFDKIIIMHNPRNLDALARARHLLLRSGGEKVMLLLPRLDLLDDREDEEVLTELDALIETTSERSNILVVGTASRLVESSEADHLFGVTLILPGAPVIPAPHQALRGDVHRMLAGVAEFYVDSILKAGYRLAEISREGFIARVLLAVTNPAQIEDIAVLCQTSAIYRQRLARQNGNKQAERVIGPDILELALRRVVIGGEAVS